MIDKLKTDTPESDKAKIAFTSLFANDDAYWIPYAIGKKLERERDAAQKAMGDARDILLDAMPDANAPTKILAEMIVAERDRYQESADALVDRLAAAQERMINAERERDEWKAKYIQQNKDLGCEMMDPNRTIWDYAKKVQRELTVVTKQRDQLERRLRGELGGHPDSELWGDAGLIAATMRCLDALDTVTEQRDRLAAVLQRIRDGYGGQAAAPDCCEDCEFLIPIDEALQSLNQPTEP